MQSVVFLILCFPAVLGQNLRRHIYVYNGYGTDELHVARMQEHLRTRLHSSYNVSTIGPNAVKEGVWANNAALFVMPGGFDLGYKAFLGVEGTDEIRKYVKEGGSYLGQGAGSYFACNSIEFDLGGDYEVIGERRLKFYPGNCTGPVYGPYGFYDYRGARAAPINFRFISPTTGENEEGPINMNAYYNGGNTFHLPMANQITRCVTLGSFTEKNNIPAIVKCNTYRGLVVLAGVHLEFGTSHLNINDQNLAAVQQELQGHESNRIRVFDFLLRHLGLTLRSNAVISNL